MKEGTTVF